MLNFKTSTEHTAYSGGLQKYFLKIIILIV